MIWTDSHHTRETAESARATLGLDGFAITIANGIGNVETFVEVLGAKRVAGGSSVASAAMRAPGRAALTHMGKTSIGELDGGASARIERRASSTSTAGRTPGSTARRSRRSAARSRCPGARDSASTPIRRS
jgi:ketopantoate reductase